MDPTSPTPSIVDLRRFAADARPAPGGERFSRHYLALSQGPVTVGAVHLSAARHREAVEADEFVHALDGCIALRSGGDEIVLEPGRAAVLLSGGEAEWESDGEASAVFMRYVGASGGRGGIVPISPDPELKPSSPPLAALLTTPTPACRNLTEHLSADGEFMCGTWDSTPYARRPMRYRHHELMHLLEGQVAFEDSTGARAAFSRGDTFLILKDAECSWDSPVHVRKIFAIWRPA